MLQLRVGFSEVEGAGGYSWRGQGVTVGGGRGLQLEGAGGYSWRGQGVTVGGGRGLQLEGAGGYSWRGQGVTVGGGRGLQLEGVTVGWAFSRGMLQLARFPGGKGEWRKIGKVEFLNKEIFAVMDSQ